MIAVDIAHETTSLEQMNGLAKAAMTQQERDAFYECLRYEFGFSDDISDATLETLLEDTEWNQLSPDAPDTVDELREHLSSSRASNSTKSTRADALDAYDDVITYVLKGEEKTKAITAQQKAIEMGWDMTLSFSIPRITDEYLD